MGLNEAQLEELSRLVDTLQSLPEAVRGEWIAGLGPEQEVYRPSLQQLVAAQRDTHDGDFLATLPKLDESPAPRSDGLAAGDDVGPYRLLREIGRGGMGSVWLAERTDGHLKRSVALKLPHSALPQRKLAERFARERDILAALAHPHIARLYDAGVSASGRPYLALEYVEGEPLLAWCDGRRLGLRDRITLYLQALSAVQYAHERMVVHRDLKPSNMLVTAEGEVRLLDFGIAKLLKDGVGQETALTEAGGRALTPQYAAPEQVLGQPVGPASDVYALGVVLHELLTGASPYRARPDSRRELEDAILNVEPARPSQRADDAMSAARRGLAAPRLARELRGDLDTIVLKALKKQAGERYPTVNALAADLQRYLAGEPVQARPDSLAYRTRKFVMRNRWEVGVAAAVVLAFALATGPGATAAAMFALAIGLAAALWQAREARRQARRAMAAAEAARTEAETSRAALDFLRTIFVANSSAQPDPQKARQTTARELLDIGADRLHDSLDDAPEAKGAVLSIVSDMYAELGLKERAAAMAEERVRVVRRLRGPDHPEVAEQLIQVSRMLQQTSRSSERRALLADALRILDLDPAQSTETRIRLLRQLALLEHDSRSAQALDYARQAVAASEAIASADEIIAALAVLGKVEADRGDPAHAEATLKRAVELSYTVPHFHRRQRVLLIAYLGDAQKEAGSVAAAEASFREGLELAFSTSGPAHADPAQMEYRLGELLFASARTGEGLHLIGCARERVERVSGVDDSVLLPNIMRREAAMRAELGDLEQAAAIAARGRALLDAAPSDHKNVLAMVLLAQAQVMLDTAQLDEAAAALAQFDRFERGAHVLSAEREARRVLGARLFLERGDADAARALWVQAREFVVGEHRSFDNWRTLLQWGEVVLELGDADAALRVAQRTLQRIAADDAPHYLELREARASVLAGRARLAGGDVAVAIPLLERAVALATAHLDPERSPLLADALAAVACAHAQAGRPAVADSAVARADAILLRHPALAAGHRRRWEQARGCLREARSANC